MAKYSTECKRKVVQEYLVGHGNYEHIPLSLFTRWGRGYQAFSTDGFPHKENIHCRIEAFCGRILSAHKGILSGYSYHTQSKQSICACTLGKEVSRGMDALQSKLKGGALFMPRKKNGQPQDFPQDEMEQ